MKAKDLILKVVNETEEGKFEIKEFKPYMTYENFVGCILAEAIILRPVGFKDKNGKEIYEGDINQGGYVITYLANLEDGYGMEAGWYLQRDNFESWSKLECNEDIEIIGNVFETPEKAINNCNTDYVKMFL